MTAKKTYTHCVIAAVLGLLIKLLLQPANGLTELGVNVLSVTIPTLYLWLTVNTSWCALLFMGLLVMTRAMSATEVWAGSMGHFSVITMIVFAMLNHALKETGVIDKIALWFITRKAAQKRPYVFLGLFFLSNLVIGMFVDNLSLAIIYVGLATALSEMIGVRKGDSYYSALFIGILWCNVVISIASPIAHAPVLILIGMIQSQIGITVTYGQWFAFGVPFALLMFLSMMLAIAVWKPDTTAFMSFDLDELRKKDRPLDRKGKVTAAVFVITLLLIFLPEVLKGVLPKIAGYWSAVGVIVPAILAVSALSLIHIDGEPVLDYNAAARSLPLSPIIFAGVVCVMSTPVSSPATGISLWLSNVLQPAFSSLPPLLILVLLTLGALVMTNFFSNVVTMVLFFNIGLALLSAGEANLGAFAAVIGYASSMASLTPAACAPAPLIYGPGHVTVGGVLKANLVFVLLSFIVILLVVYPLSGLLLI